MTVLEATERNKHGLVGEVIEKIPSSVPKKLSAEDKEEIRKAAKEIEEYLKRLQQETQTESAVFPQEPPKKEEHTLSKEETPKKPTEISTGQILPQNEVAVSYQIIGTVATKVVEGKIIQFVHGTSVSVQQLDNGTIVATIPSPETFTQETLVELIRKLNPEHFNRRTAQSIEQLGYLYNDTALYAAKLGIFSDATIQQLYDAGYELKQLARSNEGLVIEEEKKTVDELKDEAGRTILPEDRENELYLALFYGKGMVAPTIQTVTDMQPDYQAQTPYERHLAIWRRSHPDNTTIIAAEQPLLAIKRRVIERAKKEKDSQRGIAKKIEEAVRPESNISKRRVALTEQTAFKAGVTAAVEHWRKLVSGTEGGQKTAETVARIRQENLTPQEKLESINAIFQSPYQAMRRIDMPAEMITLLNTAESARYDELGQLRAQLGCTFAEYEAGVLEEIGFTILERHLDGPHGNLRVAIGFGSENVQVFTVDLGTGVTELVGEEKQAALDKYNRGDIPGREVSESAYIYNIAVTTENNPALQRALLELSLQLHPHNAMALLKMYQLTGDGHYLTQAKAVDKQIEVKARASENGLIGAVAGGTNALTVDQFKQQVIDKAFSNEEIKRGLSRVAKTEAEIEAFVTANDIEALVALLDEQDINGFLGTSDRVSYDRNDVPRRTTLGELGIALQKRKEQIEAAKKQEAIKPVVELLQEINVRAKAAPDMIALYTEYDRSERAAGRIPKSFDDYIGQMDLHEVFDALGESNVRAIATKLEVARQELSPNARGLEVSLGTRKQKAIEWLTELSRVFAEREKPKLESLVEIFRGKIQAGFDADLERLKNWENADLTSVDEWLTLIEYHSTNFDRWIQQLDSDFFRTEGNLSEYILIEVQRIDGMPLLPATPEQVATTREYLKQKLGELLRKHREEALIREAKETERHVQFFRITKIDQDIIKERGLVHFLKLKAINFARDSTWGKVPAGAFFETLKAELGEAETYQEKILTSKEKAHWPFGVDEPAEYKRMQNDIINGAIISASLASGEIKEWEQALSLARSMGIDGCYRLLNIDGVEEIAQLEITIMDEKRIQDGEYIATDDLNKIEEIAAEMIYEQVRHKAVIGGDNSPYVKIFDDVIRRILHIRGRGGVAYQTRDDIRQEYEKRIAAEPRLEAEVKEEFIKNEVKGRARMGRWINMIKGDESTITAKGVPVDEYSGMQVGEITHRAYPLGVWQGYEVVHPWQLTPGQRQWLDITALYNGRDSLNEQILIEHVPDANDGWRPDKLARDKILVWNPRADLKNGEKPWILKSKLQAHADVMRKRDLLMFEAQSFTNSYRMRDDSLIPRPWMNELYERILHRKVAVRGDWKDMPFCVGVQLKSSDLGSKDQAERENVPSTIRMTRIKRDRLWRNNAANFFPEWGMKFVYEVAPMKAPGNDPNDPHPENAQEYGDFIKVWNNPVMAYLDVIAANRGNPGNTWQETWRPLPGMSLDPANHLAWVTRVPPDPRLARAQGDSRRMLSLPEEIAHRRYTYFMDNWGDIMNTYRQIGYHNGGQGTPDPYQRNFGLRIGSKTTGLTRSLTNEEAQEINEHFAELIPGLGTLGITNIAENFQRSMAYLTVRMKRSSIAEHLANDIEYVHIYQDMPAPDTLLHIEDYRKDFTKALQANGRDLESIVNSYIHHRLGGEAIMTDWVKGKWANPEEMEEGVHKAAKEAEWWGLDPDYSKLWIRFWSLYCYAIQTGSEPDLVVDSNGRLEMDTFGSILNWIGFDPTTFFAKDKSLFATLTHELDFPDLTAEQAHQLFYKNAHHMHSADDKDMLLRAQALLDLDPEKKRLMKRTILRFILLFFPAAVIKALFGEATKITSEL